MSYEIFTCEKCEGDYFTGPAWEDECYCQGCYLKLFPSDPEWLEGSVVAPEGTKILAEIKDDKDLMLCVCGHLKEDHHISWFPGGYEIVEECEFYGWNEDGGWESTEDGWVEHCFKFKEDKNGG